MPVERRGLLLRKPMQAMSQLRKRAIRVTEQMRVRNAVVYNNLAVLAQRYEPAAGLAGHELKVFSQNGEDGILAEIFNRIGVESRFFVEFGVGAGREGNSVLLADVYNWSGLFIEGSQKLFNELQYKYVGIERVSTRQEIVTVENVQRIFSDDDVPTNFDLLSIDIDSNDYWVWQAITTYMPRVVVCEYNGAIDPTSALTQPYMPTVGWDGTEYFGASLRALEELGLYKGYTLVHADLTGTNAFFVVNEHAARFLDCMPVPARRAVPSFTDFRHRPDNEGRAYQTPDPAVRPAKPRNGHDAPVAGRGHRCSEGDPSAFGRCTTGLLATLGRSLRVASATLRDLPRALWAGTGPPRKLRRGEEIR